MILGWATSAVALEPGGRHSWVLKQGVVWTEELTLSRVGGQGECTAGRAQLLPSQGPGLQEDRAVVPLLLCLPTSARGWARAQFLAQLGQPLLWMDLPTSGATPSL